MLFDKATYDKLYKEVPSYKLITPSVVSERLKVTGSLARRGLQELLAKGKCYLWQMRMLCWFLLEYFPFFWNWWSYLVVLIIMKWMEVDFWAVCISKYIFFPSRFDQTGGEASCPARLHQDHQVWRLNKHFGLMLCMISFHVKLEDKIKVLLINILSSIVILVNFGANKFS